MTKYLYTGIIYSKFYLHILKPNLLQECPTFQYFTLSSVELRVKVPNGSPYGQTSSVADGPSTKIYIKYII